MSDALKTLGNLHYANKEYEKAFKVYSEALEFETDPIATSRILSNRAAALLRLDRPVEAQEDAHQAICKDKHYSKGFARWGEAYFRLKQYELAQTSYARAIKETSDVAARERYQSAIDEIGKAAMASPEFDASRKGSDGLVCAMSTAWTTKLEIEKRAHSFTVKPGGGIDFLLHALDFCSKGIFALDCAIVIVSEEGCEMMEFSPASNFIAQALLLDPMGVVFEIRTPDISPYDKLGKLNIREWDVADVSKYFKVTRWTATAIIADLRKRMEREGWIRIMSIVSIISSWCIVNSWSKSLKKNFTRTGAAISDLELARDLLVEGKREWGEEFSTQDEDTYGSKRIRLIEARATELYIETTIHTEQIGNSPVISLDAIDLVAHSIIKNNPRRSWPSDLSDVNRFAYHLMPIARAYIALAFTSGRRAAVPFDEVSPGQIATCDLVLAKKSSRYYDLALKLLPDDYYRKAVMMWRSIQQHLRSGGDTVARIFDLEKQALQLEEERDRFFSEMRCGTDAARDSAVDNIETLRRATAFDSKDINRILPPNLIVNVRNMPSSFDWATAAQKHLNDLGFSGDPEVINVKGMSDNAKKLLDEIRS